MQLVQQMTCRAAQLRRIIIALAMLSLLLPGAGGGGRVTADNPEHQHGAGGPASQGAQGDDSGGSHYERALAALAALQRENLALRRRIAELQAGLAAPVMHARAGQAVHVAAFDPNDPPADPHLLPFEWDFGNDAGRFSRLGGFNAAHVYEEPGTYLVTLNGRAHARIVVTLDTRPMLGVRDEAGLRMAAAQANRIVTLPAGTIEVRQTIRIARGTEIRGEGIDKSTIHWAGGRGDAPGPVLFDAPGGDNTLRGIRFTNRHTDTDRGSGVVIHPGSGAAGGNLLVIDCRFDHFDTPVSGNRSPHNVLLLGNVIPDERALSGYLAWPEGRGWVILGNRVVNSTREHVIRAGTSRIGGLGVEMILIAHNDLDNRDLRPTTPGGPGDPHDDAKSAIWLMDGRLAWVEGNTLRGAASYGPLGRGDGLRDIRTRFDYLVHRKNLSGGGVNLTHGLSHVLVDASTLNAPGSAAALLIEGPDERYANRQVADVEIRGSTLRTTTPGGRVLWVQRGHGQGHTEDVAGRLLIEDNIFEAPADAGRLVTAELPIVIDGGWRDHYSSRGNRLAVVGNLRWPPGSFVARVGDTTNAAHYRTLDAWLRLPGVEGDRLAAAEPRGSSE